MRKFDFVASDLMKNDDVKEVKLPLRATKTSGGYDFYTPIDLVIKPQETVLFWSDVFVDMPEDEILILDVRSSMGIKNDLMMANTVAVIDSDYKNADNGGNIGICLRNLKPSMKLDGYTPILANVTKVVEDEVVYDMVTQKPKILSESCILVPRVISLENENTVIIPKGERVCQGIFLKYQVAENCNSDNERSGGIGSTTK